MTFVSGNLRYLRKLANLSQQGFAEKVGLNRGNIASYEKGSAEPSLVNLLKITRYFGVDLLDFIDRDLAKELPTNRLGKGKEMGASMNLDDDKSSLLDQNEASSDETPLDLGTLTKHALDLEKIIEGLKRYHHLKLSRFDGLSHDGQLLRLDYGRLLEIASDVIDTNRQLINLMTQREQTIDVNSEKEADAKEKNLKHSATSSNGKYS